MGAFGHLQLTVQEQPNELLFKVDREFGWLGKAVLPGLGVVMLIGSVFVPDRSGRVSLAGVGLFILVLWAGLTVFRREADRNPIQTTTLSVTSERLEASGVLDRGVMFKRRSRIVVPASKVKKIAYGPGSDDDEGGLTVILGFWKSECMLPGLNREQCKMIAARIAQRFPEIGREH